jgi:formylglycine-generating enzyme required for sulfatase activity
MTPRAAMLVFVLCLTGCPTGKKPPELTTVSDLFPGGTFTMGSRDLKCGNAQSAEIDHCDSGATLDPLDWIVNLTFVPPATATVTPFDMDTHEVTNAQYAYCVDAGICTPPSNVASGDEPSYYGNSAYDKSPVVWVTREQALEYCRWVNRTLPSEAQWEYAARIRNGSTLATYPWDGDAPPDCGGSAHYAVYKRCKEHPQPIDYSSQDVTPAGLRNMASNVSEWVLDDWNEYAYCYDLQGYDPDCQKLGQSCADCVTAGTQCGKSCGPNAQLAICTAGTYSEYHQPGGGGDPTVRGGSFVQGPCYVRLFNRRKGPKEGAEDIGFRCVSSN